MRDSKNPLPRDKQRPSSRRSFVAGLAMALMCSGAAMAGSVSYTYDALGRLATVVYSGATSTTTITYSYDAVGNRTTVATTNP